MSFQNKIADFIRDLPILDFMAPYYKVNQIVVQDVKYDVNFAAVPQVDRCTSCHLGIDNPDFIDDSQPYTTHPNLDLYITSASPHPMDNFGCTSCHAGREEVLFISSSHTPNTPQDKKGGKKNMTGKNSSLVATNVSNKIHPSSRFQMSYKYKRFSWCRKIEFWIIAD